MSFFDDFFGGPGGDVSLGSGLTLSVVDNGGGSVTFTIGSGSPVSEIINVWACRFLGEVGGEIQSVGNRAGLGPLTVNLSPGPYLAFAMSSGGVGSPGRIFRVADDTESLHYRCMAAVREFVLQLALPGLESDPANHVLVKLPYRPGTEFSLGEGVFYFPKADSYVTEDNRRDGVTLPVHVVWIRKNTKSLSANLSQLLKQREIMFRALSGASFVNTCEVHTVKVRPGAVVLPDAWSDSFDASTVVFEMISQQESGVF